MSFSQRVGVSPEKPIQIGTMDEPLRNRLYNVLNETFPERAGSFTNYDYLRSFVLDKLGFNLESSSNSDFNKEFLRGEWYTVYDILESVFDWLNQSNKRYSILNIYETNDFVARIQGVLEKEKSGYRLVNYKFVPITSSDELDSLKKSINNEYHPVSTHMSKALTLYSDRTSPDYENSIKESISAVESMCCIITGSSGSGATLGEALKKLKDNGVVIHGALESAFLKLYGYTSDENGIRHGGIDFADAKAEDAKYMLITCSAFANYLIEKMSKTEGL